jgi:heterodisulfide reductase subunit C
MELQRTIKYEADRVRGFGREVMSVPGCELLESCIQCGTCSGVCPLSIYMDYSPRQVMALTRSDFKREVLGSYTIWLCASCYDCTVECPRQIRITDIMYELKQRAIKEGVDRKGFATPALAKSFYAMVHKNGRITESLLVMQMLLKCGLLNAVKSGFGMWRLGLNLIKTGRFSLKSESIKGIDELAKMLKIADAAEIDHLNGNGHGNKGAAAHKGGH